VTWPDLADLDFDTDFENNNSNSINREFYDNDSTVPMVPKSGAITPLYELYQHYYGAANAYVKQQEQRHGAGNVTTSEVEKWAVSTYFAPPPADPQCNFELHVKYPDGGEGYSTSCKSKEQCCAVCAGDPTCKVGVFDGGNCYVRYSMAQKEAGSGVACVKSTKVWS
jgi:hypothetical protein